ncbi:hypothetical protein F2Q70_00029160 [Brassica cretica]|uniref:Uncharacterized protein n=1 Tax=Brassica cretica TaxID=69181 RepID=A0A8S9FBB5_BRACR|nr:hypothetical protein F2Q70_00029160 [Brassica cretica]
MATSYTLLADLRVGRCSNTATPPRKQAVLRDGIQVATDEVKGLRSIKEPVRWANKPPKITESRVSISSDISSDMCSRGDNNTQDDMPGAGELTAKPYKTVK